MRIQHVSIETVTALKTVISQGWECGSSVRNGWMEHTARAEAPQAQDQYWTLWRAFILVRGQRVALVQSVQKVSRAWDSVATWQIQQGPEAKTAGYFCVVGDPVMQTYWSCLIMPSWANPANLNPTNRICLVSTLAMFLWILTHYLHLLPSSPSLSLWLLHFSSTF